MSVLAEDCLGAPITRVPASSYHEQVEIPSSIDHILCSVTDMVSECLIDWRSSLSDHAIVSARCSWPCPATPRPPVLWQPHYWLQVDALVAAVPMSDLLQGPPEVQAERLQNRVRETCESIHTVSLAKNEGPKDCRCKFVTCCPTETVWRLEETQLKPARYAGTLGSACDMRVSAGRG